jgi:hypothetical protein
MFKHCYARVRAWFSTLLSAPAVAPKPRWVPGPRVQMHLRKTARKSSQAGMKRSSP